MNYATILIDDNISNAMKINKIIKRNDGKSIAFILGNFELNGCPYLINKEERTRKLLNIGYDLIIEIPSIIYLENINNLTEYLYKAIEDLNITKFYLPSEFGSINNFKSFHNSLNFTYPSYDRLFHYYFDYFDYKESTLKTKDYIKQFYRSRVFDYLNLNLLSSFRKNRIKFKLIKCEFNIESNESLYNNYFIKIKEFFTLTPSENILSINHIDFNTLNMIKNKIYKLESFDDLCNLSAPKSFQFSSFFKSILLSMIYFNKIENISKNYNVLKCIGLNDNGAKIVREHKKNDSKVMDLINTIKPSNSLLETYQMKLELVYAYLFNNKYNSNNDLFKFPIKI